MSMDGRYFAKGQEGGAINEPKDGVVAYGRGVFETVVAHGCAVIEPEDGEDGMDIPVYLHG